MSCRSRACSAAPCTRWCSASSSSATPTSTAPTPALTGAATSTALDGVLTVPRPRFGSSLTVLSFCHKHDPVCQQMAAVDVARYQFAQHKNYTLLGEPKQAAELLAAKAGTAPPTGSLISGLRAAVSAELGQPPPVPSRGSRAPPCRHLRPTGCLPAPFTPSPASTEQWLSPAAAPPAPGKYSTSAPTRSAVGFPPSCSAAPSRPPQRWQSSASAAASAACVDRRGRSCRVRLIDGELSTPAPDSAIGARRPLSASSQLRGLIAARVRVGLG